METLIIGIVVVVSVPLIMGFSVARSASLQGDTTFALRRRWTRRGLGVIAGLALLIGFANVADLRGAAAGVMLIGGSLSLLILGPASIAMLVFALGLTLGGRGQTSDAPPSP